MLLLPQQVSDAENTSVVVHLENTPIYNVFIYFSLRDQDNAIIRPLPKIKRMISDNACLPHIVQVFAHLNLYFFCLYFHVISSLLIC